MLVTLRGFKGLKKQQTTLSVTNLSIIRSKWQFSRSRGKLLSYAANVPPSSHEASQGTPLKTEKKKYCVLSLFESYITNTYMFLF